MPNKDFSYYDKLPYRFECRFDPDDKVWVVRYPELPGCVAHGKSATSAIKLAEKFKSEWLETALDAGNTIPEPELESHSGKLLVRISPRAHSRIAEEASSENMSINTWFTQAATEKLERNGLKVLMAEFRKYMESSQGFVSWNLGQKTPDGTIKDENENLDVRTPQLVESSDADAE